MLAATILAAGASQRMGSPKALLELKGRSFLQTILDSTAELGLETYVSLGNDFDKVLSHHNLRDATVVMNRELDAGPIGSIRASIRAIEAIENHLVEGLLVWPIDFPHVSVDTVRALIDRFEMNDGPAIVVPEYEGRKGHPVIFGRSVFAELMEAPDSVGARQVVRRDASRVARIQVVDATVIDCLNTPEAYRELLRRTDQQDS